MRRPTAFSLFWLLASSTIPLSSSAFAGEAEDLVRRVDELYRAKSSEATVSMTIQTPDWKRTLRLQMWSLGMEKTFIRILSPKKDKGITTLRIDKEMWNYFPKVNKVIKVPPSMMMGAWMGSDFTNDDLVRETSLLKDYNVKLLPPEGGLKVLELSVKAKTATVWTRIITKIDAKTLLPSVQEFYDHKNRKIRTMAFSDVKSFGSRRLPSKLVLTPTQKKNHQTIVVYEKASFDQSIDEGIFSQRFMRRKF